MMKICTKEKLSVEVLAERSEGETNRYKSVKIGLVFSILHMHNLWSGEEMG